MFSLKASELKRSKIGCFLWVSVALVYAAIFQLYLLPIQVKLSIPLVAVVVVLFILPSKKIGLDEQGAYVIESARRCELVFLRANGVQLIARLAMGSPLINYYWPRYIVIFYDSLPKEQYADLRSFAAQQILLNRNDNEK
ncbi:hypothetical protein OAH87_03640 [Marinomonas sp.]|nr:hypothetical protein [Marinomonas sp.]MDB4837540.1 hypothetical protein [Marinomonas sp.]